METGASTSKGSAFLEWMTPRSRAAAECPRTRSAIYPNLQTSQPIWSEYPMWRRSIGESDPRRGGELGGETVCAEEEPRLPTFLPRMVGPLQMRADLVQREPGRAHLAVREERRLVEVVL